MRILFLHNNYPAQFKHLLPALVKKGHSIYFLSSEAYGAQIKGVRHAVLKPKDDKELGKLKGKMNGMSKKILISELFRAGFIKLRDKGFIPDLVVFHSGWGLGLHIKTVFPRAKLAAFAEWWFDWNSAEMSFDRSSIYAPSNHINSRLAERYLNLSQCHELAESDFIWTATNWQKSQFPISIQDRMYVVHEGIDNSYFFPVNNKNDVKEFTLTYVSRGLEPMRGFEHFIEIADMLLSRNKNLRLIIVGKDKACYRPLPKNMKTLGEWAVNKFKESGNTAKVSWHGRLPYKDYRKILQMSDIHFYFSRPFIASWSLLEALSSGCCIVATDIPMIREIMIKEDEKCGLLVDHCDHLAVVEAVESLVDNAQLRKIFSKNARDVATSYSHDLCLERILEKLSFD